MGVMLASFQWREPKTGCIRAGPWVVQGVSAGIWPASAADSDSSGVGQGLGLALLSQSGPWPGLRPDSSKVGARGAMKRRLQSNRFLVCLSACLGV